MIVFGLTGSLASGKTSVLKLLEKKGAAVFNTDQRIHQYYNDKRSLVYKQTAKAFPESLVNKRICRKRLSEIVFSKKAHLIKIENIVHPVIIEDLVKWAYKIDKHKKIRIAEVPLLFEKKLCSYFGKIILVITKRQILIQRIVKKYNFSKVKAQSRLALHLPAKDKIKKANFVINNNSDLKNLKKEVDLLWKKIVQS